MDENIKIRITTETAQILSGSAALMEHGNFGNDGTPSDILDAARGLKNCCDSINTKEASLSQIKDILEDLEFFKDSAQAYLKLNDQNKPANDAIYQLEEAQASLKERTNIHRSIARQVKIKLELTDILKSQADFKARLENIEKGIDTSKLPDLKALSESGIKEINNLLASLRNTSSMASGKFIEAKYATSAAAERTAANRFRILSILLMFLSIVIATIGITFKYFCSQPDDASWITLTPFFITSFLLSVPAAYMTRESSKHRRQQYLYQQYALNLEALDPFIAEIDTPERNKLKAVLAKDIFTTPHETGAKSTESYPINIHELLALLISRIEVRPGSNPDSNRN